MAFRGTLDFLARPFVFPATSEALPSFSTPFTAMMFVRAFVGGDEVFAAEFTGRGMTREPFQQRSGAGFVREEGRLDFHFQPDPIPEPATLTLVGVGLVGARWRARRLRGR